MAGPNRKKGSRTQNPLEPLLNMVIVQFKWPEPDGTGGSGSGTYLNRTESPVRSSQILSENQTKPDLSITKHDRLPLLVREFNCKSFVHLTKKSELLRLSQIVNHVNPIYLDDNESPLLVFTSISRLIAISRMITSKSISSTNYRRLPPAISCAFGPDG